MSTFSKSKNTFFIIIFPDNVLSYVLPPYKLIVYDQFNITLFFVWEINYYCRMFFFKKALINRIDKRIKRSVFVVHSTYRKYYFILLLYNFPVVVSNNLLEFIFIVFW